jgi:uncharacterized protein (DUF433 family)
MTRDIVSTPDVCCGAPRIEGTGVPTSIIAERYAAGDSLAQLAYDYDLWSPDIEAALRFELRRLHALEAPDAGEARP